MKNRIFWNLNEILLIIITLYLGYVSCNYIACCIYYIVTSVLIGIFDIFLLKINNIHVDYDNLYDIAFKMYQNIDRLFPYNVAIMLIIVNFADTLLKR